ncbi:hypothetical protein [Catellatospora chokoriensis]|uniref:Uncharacterized protein n=1 Tax=Catellatospora chokoriensis TaxID=310353 RepID=A0A8J3NS65_9ACTN|nr:hypothetical protein [Catellatospora chokoriensis]GIF90163.1 hypothetical protein Cch02nite_36070 [Catellatospora chokoriensis]
MVVVPAQPGGRISVCSRHGNPVTCTASARFRSRPPAWLQTAAAVLVVAFGLPVAYPAARYLDDPDPELYLLLLGTGLFAGWLAHNIMVKLVDVPAWGFCPACRARRANLVTAATSCFVLVPVSCALYVPVVLPEQLGEGEPSTLAEIVRWAVVVAPAVFAITGVVLSAYARWAVVAGGVAGRDGTTVEFRRPAARFAQQVTGHAGRAELS